MADPDPPAPATRPAGRFSTWLVEIQSAITAGATSDVPCGACTACCTSGQFVHVGPDEPDTLAHIPRELLFPAPRLPRGHRLLGYDERGHCPMLRDGECSIYDHRPRACRTYDCRVFPAAGIDADDDKPAIVAQARRWHFDEPDPRDRALHDAVRAAAVQLEARDDGHRPTTRTQLAVEAIRIHAGLVEGS